MTCFEILYMFLCYISVSSEYNVNRSEDRKSLIKILRVKKDENKSKNLVTYFF